MELWNILLSQAVQDKGGAPDVFIILGTALKLRIFVKVIFLLLLSIDERFFLV